MSKQNFFILLLVVIIIFLVILLIWFFTPIKNIFRTVPLDQAPLSQASLVEKRITEVQQYDLALSREDPNLCKEIDYLPTRDVCYEKLAEARKDPSLCQKISLLADLNRCQFTIIKDKALSAKSIQPCQELVEQQLIEQCQIEVQAINFCQEESCLDSVGN